MEPGWNQVGTPFTVNTSISSSIIAGDKFSTANAVGTSNVKGITKFIKWDPTLGQYMDETSALIPKEGYFVFNPNTMAVYMWVDNPSNKPGQLPPSSVVVSMAPGDPVPPPPPGMNFSSGGGGGGGCGPGGGAAGFPFHLLATALIVLAARTLLRRG